MDRTLCGLLPEELEAWLVERGERSFRAAQVLSWVHRRGTLDPAEMTNISRTLREVLSLELPPVGARVDEVLTSADGTRKLRVALADGASIETVLIPDGAKLTQCISTQVGCGFRCRFCLSGADGLIRDLRADEIVAQLHLARPHHGAGERLTNVVLMGSGEPLANLDETIRAVRLLTSPRAVDLSTRRVTVSTLGLPKGIARLGEAFDGMIGLAVSLHGPDDETRSELMPKVKAVPLDDVLEALRRYPLPKRRRITIEYVVVRGVNDHPAQAAILARRLAGLRCKVNLIPFNEHGASDLRAPDPSDVERLLQVFLEKNVATTIRRRRGEDIGAACGQLAARRHDYVSAFTGEEPLSE